MSIKDEDEYKAGFMWLLLIIGILVFIAAVFSYLTGSFQ